MLAAAMLARWRPLGGAAHPALALAIASALRSAGDTANAVSLLEQAVSIIGDEPSWTRLQLVRALAPDSAAATSLARELPELR